MKRTQTIRTLAGAALLALIVSGLFWFMTASIRGEAAAAEEASRTDDRIKVTLEQQALVLEMEIGLRAYLITGDPDQLASFHAAAGSLAARKREFSELVGSDRDARARAEQVAAGLASYVEDYAQPLVADVRAGAVASADRRRYAVVGKRRIDELRAHFDELIAGQRARADIAHGRARQLADRALLLGGLGLAGSLLIVLLFTAHQLRFVLVPVRRVAAAARRLAGGDLSTRVPASGGGEVGELARAFNGMADSLEHARDELESQNAELEAQQAELERAVDELAREKERIDRLYRVGRAISAGAELADVAATIVEQLAEIGAADLGVLYVLTDGDAARPVAARGLALDALEPVVPNAGLAGRALAEGRSIAAAHGECGLTVPALGGDVVVANEVHVPLVTATRAVGVLTLARVTRGPFGGADLAQLDYLAGRASSAVENALALCAARDQAALHQAVVDTASDAFVTIDQDSVISAWNAAAERLFGWSADEVIGTRLRDVIVPERHLDVHDEIIGDGLAAAAAEPLELDARHRDGHEFPIELVVSPLERNGRLTFNAFMRDISHRRNTERYMRAQLAVTQTLAESTSLEDARAGVLPALGEALGWAVGAAWLADADTGLIRPVSFWAAEGVDAGAFRELTLATAFERGEGIPGCVWATGEPVWMEDLSDAESFKRADAAAAAGLRSAISFPVIHDDHFIGMVEFFSTDVERPDPSLLAALATIGSQISQFSKRKRVELEADRLKDEFFALVSHELRTPLTSIIGYLELVLEDSEALDPQTGRFLQVVERNSRRLHRLVGDLLFVAQVEAGRLSLDRSAVPLQRVVVESVEAARPRAEENGVVLNARIESVGHCDGDADRLGQMLDNLVSNALKFTPEGGTVDIYLTEREGCALLEVRDSGVGIPRSEQDQLFQRFFRSSTATEHAIPGVGLGLTISRAIVEAHGGSIGFRSTEGRGTTFTIELPLVAPRPQSDPSDTPKEFVL